MSNVFLHPFSTTMKIALLFISFRFGVLRKSTVLASGGRYDSLVATFHDVIDNRPNKTYCDLRPESRGQHITGGVIYVSNLNAPYTLPNNDQSL